MTAITLYEALHCHCYSTALSLLFGHANTAFGTVFATENTDGHCLSLLKRGLRSQTERPPAVGWGGEVRIICNYT